MKLPGHTMAALAAAAVVLSAVQVCQTSRQGPAVTFDDHSIHVDVRVAGQPGQAAYYDNTAYYDYTGTFSGDAAFGGGGIDYGVYDCDCAPSGQN